MDTQVETKEELRKRLKAKLRNRVKEKQMGRLGKANQQKMLDKAFDQLGIDKERLMADINAVKKDGTLNTTIERLQSLARK